MKATKKSISSLLRRKNKGVKKVSSDATSCSLESEFPQVSKTSSNSESMTCPNNKCGRVIDKPLELIDLAKPSDESSLVCPYCLSKLELTQMAQETVTETFSTSSEEEPRDVTKEEEEKCPHFVGYLSKRPKDASIPDFCLTCPQMMKCLLG